MQPSKKLLQKIIKALAPYKPQKIILFGSAARNRLKENSDLDLIIIKDSKKDFYSRIGEVLRLVRDITPKPPIDFLVYTPSEFEKMKKENYFVKEEVLEKGKVLYE